MTTWHTEIERYYRASQRWRDQSEKIVKLYLHQHRLRGPNERRFAILWANIRTMQPAIYARPPKIVVSRRYRDRDPAARKAAEVLERCINTGFDLYRIDQVLEAVRDDLLLAGRGTAWVRYEADIADDVLRGERACVDYVHWSDFGHTVARRWSDVNAVWRCVYLTREKVVDRFGANTANKLRYEYRPDYASRYGADGDEQENLTPIYEIWDRASERTIWYSREQEVTLEESEPPLSFRDFFPCPPPAYATRATNSLFPVPDYLYYQDQAEEIDDLTNKIATLTGWLRMKGFMPGGPSSEGPDAIEQLLRLDNDQVLVKVESWAGFAERGGAAQIQWLPLDTIVTALREAINARRELKNDVFELTGLSDIIRGQSEASETLGAQQIKAQSASRRIALMQREMARFARDLAELVGEVVAEMYQPETMQALSGLDLATAPPQALPTALDPQQMQQYALNAQVISLLRDDRTRGYRIEVETDSTIEADEQQEKQARVEFLTAVGGFIREAMPLAQNVPQIVPVLQEMLMFLVRGFRVGRSMEDVIEQSMEQLAQAAQAAQAQRADPNAAEQGRLMLEAEHKRAELQLRQQEMQIEAELKRQQIEADRELKLLTLQQKAVPAAAIEMKHNSDAIAAPIADVVARLGESLAAAQAQQTQVIVAGLERMAAALTAPKRVLRDASGRVVGAETITSTAH